MSSRAFAQISAKLKPNLMYRSFQCTNMENDQFSSGGSRPLSLDALMPMKVLNLFIVLKLHFNLRFLINFEYYLIKNELENA